MLYIGIIKQHILMESEMNSKGFVPRENMVQVERASVRKVMSDPKPAIPGKLYANPKIARKAVCGPLGKVRKASSK